jgi:hypothetical protein
MFHPDPAAAKNNVKTAIIVIAGSEYTSGKAMKAARMAMGRSILIIFIASFLQAVQKDPGDVIAEQ